jgi:hypothetical protein
MSSFVTERFGLHKQAEIMGKLIPHARVHAVSLTPHAQKNFRTSSKSENHMQNSDGMQKKKIKNACGVNDTACTMHEVSMTPHARSMRYH